MTKPTSAQMPARCRRIAASALALAVVATSLALAAGSTPASAASGDITTVVGEPGVPWPASSIRQQPVGVAIEGDRVYVSDQVNHMVRVLDTTTGIMTTVAGAGTRAFRGDGGRAAYAHLSDPADVAVDSSGNLYIADSGNHRVRRVDAATKLITTVAGTGTGGFSGDGGPATSAKLSQPNGVAVDPAGNLFIADTNNHRIRKVDGSGTITTVVGFGAPSAATAALLAYPQDVLVDSSGILHIADTQNHRVVRVDPVSQVVTTVAGTGTAGYGGDGGEATSAALNYPSRLGIDASGGLYIADTANNRVRRVEPSGSATVAGTITTVAGDGTTGFGGDDGPATLAQLSEPQGVAVAPSGALYIADTGNNRVRYSDTSRTISTVAGTGTAAAAGFGGDKSPATSAQLSWPGGLVLDPSGNLFIADQANHRVRKVDPDGTITTVAGTGTFGYGGDDGPATSAQLSSPVAVATDASGNLYIADRSNAAVRKVDVGGTITTVAGTGTRGYSGDNGPAASAQLSGPSGVATDASDNLYIADTENNRIRRVDAATGTITTVAGDGTTGFSGDGGPATAAQLHLPLAVATDGSGHLYIADGLNYSVRRVDALTQVITTVAGTGACCYNGDGQLATGAQLAGPLGVAVDSAGNVFIGDTYNHRIRRIDAASKRISTVAGVGPINDSYGGFTGDGGPATTAALSAPTGLAISPAGDLFIADRDNHRIRKVAGAAATALRRAASVADFGGDTRSDHAVFRPSDGTWYAKDPATGATTAISYGVSGDVPTPGDFDGDKKADAAVYRPTEGTWYVRNSSNGSQVATPWGTGSDIAVPADYDGDAKADIAVYRPAEGTWYVRRSSDGAIAIASWGADGDIPVVADYDGDNRADHAVYRPSEGTWYVRNSSNGATSAGAWGTSGDVPTPGDFDGDKKADKALYRPSEGVWYVKNTTGAPDTALAWGAPDDIPVAGNFDDDAKADVAVFRPTEGTWYVVRSSDGARTAAAWGTAGDVPLPLPNAIGRFFSRAAPQG